MLYIVNAVNVSLTTPKLSTLFELGAQAAICMRAWPYSLTPLVSVP